MKDLIPDFIRLDDGFFGWSMSAFEGAQTPENALICRSILDDQTIVEAMYQSVSHSPSDVNEAVCEIGRIEFLQNALNKMGYHHGSYEAKKKATFRVFGELIRCIANDVIYGAFICKDVKVIDTSDMPESTRDIIEKYERLSSSYTRVIKSLRATAEFMATKDWLEIDSQGKVKFSIESREMCQGLVRVFVDNMADSLLNRAARRKDSYDKVAPSTLLQPGVNIVVAAVLGIYGNNGAVDPDGAAIGTAEHIVNLLCGNRDGDTYVKKLVSQLALFAASQQKVVDGLRKEIVDADAGAKSRNRKKPRSLDRLDLPDLSKLGHHKTRPSVIKAHHDGTLTATAREAKRKTGNGKVYALIDCSGSTLGSHGVANSVLPLDLLFELFAICLAKSARQSKMDATIVFYGTNILHAVEFNKTDSDVKFRQNLYGLTGRAGTYGNSECVAFNYVLDLMAVEYRMKNQPQTLVFLTDGMILTDGPMRPQGLNERLSKIENPDLRILPMIAYPTIDRDFATAFKGCQFIHLKDIEQFGEAFSDLIRYVADVPEEALVQNPYKQIQPPLD